MPAEVWIQSGRKYDILVAVTEKAPHCTVLGPWETHNSGPCRSSAVL